MASNGLHDEMTSPLGRYWDALLRGRSVDSTDVDPTLAATVRHLHAHDDALGADRHFADRLLEDLMHTATARTPLPLPTHPARLQVLDTPVAPRSLPQFGSSWPHGALAQLATAALVLLTLVGSFFAFGPGRPGQSPSAPAFMPALSATPAAPESAGVATTLLLDLVIPTLGADEAFVQLDRYTFAPATTMDVEMHGGRVPEVFFLAEGELKVRADNAPQPVRVIRSEGAQAEEALATGEAATLVAGDAAIFPENGAATFMNQAAEPAVALLLLMPSNLMPPGGTAIEHKTSTGNNQQVSAPLHLILERVTLAPDAALPGADDAEIEPIIDLVDPDRVMDARIGSNGSLRNAGDEPLEAYVLTVSSDAAGS